jgi:hypothetical protein
LFYEYYKGAQRLLFLYMEKSGIFVTARSCYPCYNHT